MKNKSLYFKVFMNAWDESKTLYSLSQKEGTILWKKDLSETGLTSVQETKN